MQGNDYYKVRGLFSKETVRFEKASKGLWGSGIMLFIKLLQITQFPHYYCVNCTFFLVLCIYKSFKIEKNKSSTLKHHE